MNSSSSGQVVLKNTNYIISEINELIHINLNKQWMADEWKKLDNKIPTSEVHPLVCVAYTANQQIHEFMQDDKTGITPEIFEISELAIKINALKRNNTRGLQPKLTKLMSFDFSLYRTVRYEIQIAGMLLQRGHNVEFVEEGDNKTPDILVANLNSTCEIECKHKEPGVDQLDYIKSVYNNTQKARKQFSKECPGIIAIEIEKSRFDEFQSEKIRLEAEINRALRNSSSISGVLLTSKIDIEEENDYVYRHRVIAFPNSNARHLIPDWLTNNLISN